MSPQISLLKATLDSCCGGILIIDKREGTIVVPNQQFLALWNLRASQLDGLDEFEIFDLLRLQFRDPDQFPDIGRNLLLDSDQETLELIPLLSHQMIECVSKPLVIQDIDVGRVWNFRDVTREVRAREIESARAEAMTLVAMGADLHDILHCIVRGVERVNPSMICSILLADHNQKFLSKGACPSLPDHYNRSTEGLLIGPTAGSCGTAAFRKERVIVEDIETNPLWSQFRLLAKSAGLAACWSEPILDPQQNILGTFAIYYREKRAPSSEDLITIAEAAHLAAIAIHKKRGEELVRSHEERFRSVFESSKDAIVLATAAGTFDCNRRAVELFEASSKADFMRHNLFTMSPMHQPNDIESASAAQYHLMQGYQEGSHEYEWAHCTRKGREFPAEVVLHSFLYEGQRVLQFTIRDLSERKRSEQILNSQREKLVAASKMSSLGEMAGGVAHEINNPLAIIIGQTSLLTRYLQRDRLDNEQLASGLFKIESTAQRIAKIVNGLRSFSRNSEHEPMEMVLISEIVDQTLDLCQEKFWHHNIELVVDVETEIVLECRASQIAQVIMNLLSNAFDAVEKLDDKWIKLDVYSTQSYLTIVVCDSGAGINPAIREKIMQPFFTTKEVGKGTGLGLSISRGISEDHGGLLFYDTDAPNSTFVFTLPLSQQGRINQQAVIGLSRNEQLRN